MQQLAILCPGQGAQDANMLANTCVEVRSEFAANWQHLQEFARQQNVALLDWPSVMQDPSLMYTNLYAQTTVMAYSLAAWQALQQYCHSNLAASARLGNAILSPSMLAGYSLGELSVCYVAGMLESQQCLQLVLQRASAMDACAAQCMVSTQTAVELGNGQCMAAVNFPANTNNAQAFLLQQEGVAVAIENSPRDWIVAGTQSAMQALRTKLENEGANWRALPVQIAAHTSLMQPASALFAQAMAAQDWREPQSPLLAGISAQPQYHSQQVRENLAKQISQTIRWGACMDALYESGIRLVLELGPGTSLSRMLQQAYPEMTVRSMTQFRSLAGVVKWLENQIN